MASPPLRSVLVLTDFSAGAQLALARALKLPIGPATRLSVLHVLPGDIPPGLRREAIDEAKRSIEKMVARLPSGAARPKQLEAVVAEGHLVTQALERARAVSADVVVIGRHGRRPFLDLLIGSSAQKVLRHAEVPVLLVQKPATEAYRRPLLALELERGAPALVRRALRVLGPTLKRLPVVHAARVAFEEFVVVPDDARDASRAKLVKDSGQALQRLLKKVPGARFDVEVQHADARAFILREATQRDADLLVLGSHPRTGADRFLVGSVAEWVLERAPCDVLVLRAPRREGTGR